MLDQFVGVLLIGSYIHTLHGVSNGFSGRILPMVRLLLLGHRGARFQKGIVENTFAAFDFALAHGCDGFEFDVRLTVDGEAVICHDAIVGKMRIDAHSAKELGLPLLKDVFSRYYERAFLDIELKVAGLEKITVDLLREFSPSRGFVVSSFLPEVLRTTRALNKDIPLGLICETRPQLALWKELPVEYVFPHYTLLSSGNFGELKAGGKTVVAWTVNSAEEMRRLSKMGVDGIISDNPKKLAAALRPAEK